MTWASVSFEHKCPSEGDFLLWYSESMSEPELCYCAGGNKLDQNFCFYQSLFVHEYLNVSWRMFGLLAPLRESDRKWVNKTKPNFNTFSPWKSADISPPDGRIDMLCVWRLASLRSNETKTGSQTALRHHVVGRLAACFSQPVSGFWCVSQIVRRRWAADRQTDRQTDRHGSVLLRSCYKYVTINTLNTVTQLHQRSGARPHWGTLFVFCFLELLDVKCPDEMSKE